MPDGVPPAVMKSFAALVPAFVILIVTAGIQLAVKLAGTRFIKWYLKQFNYHYKV